MKIENIPLIKEAGKKCFGKYFFKYGIFFLFLRYRGKDPLLVYQMGKVGSNTILHSLKRLELERPIFHVHHLTYQGVKRVMKEQCERIKGDKELYLFYEKQRYLSEYVHKKKQKKHWYVVTLVGDPIARNIASFFYEIERFVPNGTKEIKRRALSVESLLHFFMEKFYHLEPINWFDSELKEVFGIDVFKGDFPKKRGYKIVKGDMADALVLKLECLNGIAEDAFYNFLHIHDLKLTNVNTAKEQYYYSVYCEFRDQVKFPAEYLDSLYDTKFMRHFYSREEIERFKERWLKRN